MPVDKDKIKALADRIRQNGKVDVNRFVDGGPETRHNNGRDYTLDEYKNEKRNEIIGAAVDKALSRKYGVAPRVGDPSCIYTVTDNFGRKYRVAGNQSFMADPGRYGFIVNGPLDNSGVGDIYQFIDKGGKPYHAVMITGYDEDGNPLVSYSHGNAPAYDPDNIYSPDVQMEANERWEMSETPESFGENDYLVRQYGNYDNYFKSRMREWSEISSSDYRRNKPLWRAYGLADTAHEFEGDNVPDSYETYRFVGTPDDNSRWEAEYYSFPKSIGSLPRVDVSLPAASRSDNDGLLRRYEDGGPEGDIDLPYSGGGYSGGRAGDPRVVAANSSNKYLRIGNNRYWSAYDSLVNGGATPEDSDRLARILAAQSALETGWVDRNDTNNYAGYRYNGKNMSFGSPVEFWDYHIKNLDEKWPGWRDADSVQAYYNIVNHPDLCLTTREKFDAYNRTHRDNPVYIYAPDWENENYLGKLKSVYDRYINKYVPTLGNALSGGGGIHIKKSHKGLFTAKAKRAGQGVQEYASHVLANK